MPSGGRQGDIRKHRDHLRLVERMLRDGLATQLRRCKSMQQAFQILRSYPMVGDFLAYQFITDINYSTLTDFSEMAAGAHSLREAIAEMQGVPMDSVQVVTGASEGMVTLMCLGALGAEPDG